MSSSPDQPPAHKNDLLLFGGLTGLCAAAILQIIDKQPHLDSYLGYAVYCFALALPVLVASFLLETLRPAPGEKPVGRALFDLLGVLGAVAGFVLLFFQINFWSGIVFLASAAFGVVVVARALRRPPGGPPGHTR